MAKKYDASAITVLEGLEGVQKKISMYIGSADTTGVTHLFKEIIGNSLDESSNGHGMEIAFSIQGTKMTVYDTGRGIPVGKVKGNSGLDALTAVATKLHAGGKLNAADGNYANSLGTHGVGLAVVNAVSTTMNIWSHRDGKVYQQTFKKGKPVTEVVVVKAAPKFQGKAWKSGTVVEWETDFSCFDKGAKVDPKAIFAWLKSVSWFVTSPKGNKRVPITFNYDINGKTGTIVAKSLRAYVEQRVAKLKDVEIMEDTFMVDRTDGCDFVGAWTTSPDSLFDSACNAAPTTDGGTHLKGAMRAVEDAFRKIAKKSQVFKQADLLAGFIGCFNVRIPSPRFDSQSKNRLTSPEADKLAYDAVLDVASRWIRKNKESALQIVARAVAINDAMSNSKIAKQLASALKTNKSGKNMLPLGLLSSTTRNPEEREIYLCEGNSASGSCRAASDRRYQEVLALRGKILNVEKSDSKLNQSKAIIDILQSIGWNPKSPTDPLRVGKIMILADADPDGPLDGDTKVLVKDRGYVTIRQLAEEYELLQQPVTLYSYDAKSTSASRISESIAVDFSSREITNREYTVTTTTGGYTKCTANHRWPIIQSDGVSVVYKITTELAVGDILKTATSTVAIKAISLTTLPEIKDFYCATVYGYGNFIINNGQEDIVTGNCHIEALCLSVLWKTVPHLFQSGSIFVVNSPLYVYSSTSEKFYGSSLKELVSKVKGKFDQTKVTRVKGLAEMRASDLAEIAFNPRTRMLTRVHHPGANAIEVSQAMGQDTVFRKKMMGFA